MGLSMCVMIIASSNIKERESIIMQPEMRGAPNAASPKRGRGKRISMIVRELRISTFVVVVGCVLIIILLAAWLGFTVPGIKPENTQINKNEYQAVFLTNGQVYFGKVGTLNSNYLVLTNIFYLQTNSASGTSNNPQNGSKNNSLTLVKLGISELHAPEDKMVINQSQVSFWENLKDSSKVVSAIKQYNANPSAANSTSTVNSSSSSSGQ